METDMKVIFIENKCFFSQSVLYFSSLALCHMKFYDIDMIVTWKNQK